MSFEKRFSGKTKYVAPVQAQAGEWQNYLSAKEQQQYSQAKSWRGPTTQLAGLALYGAYFLAGASTAPGLLAGAAGCAMMFYGGVRAGIDLATAIGLENRAARRQGDLEVFRRHGPSAAEFKP